VQSTQPTQWGEPPDFVAAAGDLERVDVEGRELLALSGSGE
jgi:hypothetical protein